MITSITSSVELIIILFNSQDLILGYLLLPCCCANTFLNAVSIPATIRANKKNDEITIE
jgi:hypothetical protein